ncbi:MAG: flagellar hook-basal body complex protein [Lachnospiraceae bacterium]|nr:flagellar hook-basal body complex protein [Lachnospiraceae bacterium]
MMRSMYSGVAGLKTHQTKMDVIGNNIANVNTTAYKSQSITFSELMYQTTQSASGPSATTGKGGVNARQIGLGVKSGAINTSISSQGATQTTNNPFDIRITGDAFFVVSDGARNFFTRDGSFYVDGGGNLAMTSNGYNVMGWGVDPETGNIRQDNVQPLRIMSPENMTYPPEATTKAYLAGIIDKNDTNVNSTSGMNRNLQFYDSLGYSYTARLNFKATDQEGVFALELGNILDSDNNPLPEAEMNKLQFGEGITIKKETSITLATGYEWDGTTLKKDGNNVDTTDDAALAAAYGLTAADLTKYKIEVPDGADKTKMVSLGEFLKDTNIGTDQKTKITSKEQSAQGFTVNYDPTNGKFIGINGVSTQPTITLGLSAISSGAGTDSRFEDIEIDFSTTTMFNNAGSSTLAATTGDVVNKSIGTGRKLGEMSGVSVQDNGMIYASYDNGQTRLLGQIAVAEFANASGLQKEGDNLYSATLNSGEFDGIGVDVTANGGYLTTGVLEMSNVDLSSEFTEMITTQRGFQANSRIITVSDTLLEELVNLKR